MDGACRLRELVMLQGQAGCCRGKGVLPAAAVGLETLLGMGGEEPSAKFSALLVWDNSPLSGTASVLTASHQQRDVGRARFGVLLLRHPETGQCCRQAGTLRGWGCVASLVSPLGASPGQDGTTRSAQCIQPQARVTLSTKDGHQQGGGVL